MHQKAKWARTKTKKNKKGTQPLCASLSVVPQRGDPEKKGTAEKKEHLLATPAASSSVAGSLVFSSIWSRRCADGLCCPIPCQINIQKNQSTRFAIGLQLDGAGPTFTRSREQGLPRPRRAVLINITPVSVAEVIGDPVGGVVGVDGVRTGHTHAEAMAVHGH